MLMRAKVGDRIWSREDRDIYDFKFEVMAKPKRGTDERGRGGIEVLAKYLEGPGLDSWSGAFDNLPKDHPSRGPDGEFLDEYEFTEADNLITELWFADEIPAHLELDE